MNLKDDSRAGESLWFAMGGKAREGGGVAVVVGALLLGLLVWVFVRAGGQALLLLPFVILIALGLALSWAWMTVVGFELTPTGLRIHYRLRRRTVPYHRIRSCVLLPSPDALGKGATATMHSRDKAVRDRFNSVRVLAAGLGDWVAVEFHRGRPLVISPRRPKEFVDELNRRADSADAQPGLQGNADRS